VATEKKKREHGCRGNVKPRRRGDRQVPFLDPPEGWADGEDGHPAGSTGGRWWGTELLRVLDTHGMLSGKGWVDGPAEAQARNVSEASVSFAEG